jgi:uncharacterized membrane protein
MLYSPLLSVHIAGGIAGILSGMAALIYRKGSARHAVAGKVFVAAMLTMASAAVYLAVLKHQRSNFGAGILTFYLILTAWLTARRRDGETSKYDWAAVVIPVAVGVLTWVNGIRVLRSGATSENGVPVGMNFFMGTVMLLAAVGDVRMLVRGGVYGAKRMVRHLWRMCFGLFIATGSFFLGQQQVFPKLLRGSPALFVPALLPLVLLIFWVLRVWIGKMYEGSQARKAQVPVQKETAA